MARFLIDVNLPYRFSLWAGDDFVHARDLGERWSDSENWAYARSRNLVMVSKDADFSDRILVSQPLREQQWLLLKDARRVLGSG